MTPDDPNDREEPGETPRWPEAEQSLEQLRDLPFAVSPDFVDRTLERILEDPSGIEWSGAETSEQESDPLPQGLFAHFRSPEPSSDFVDRTIGRLRAAGAIRPSTRADTEESAEDRGFRRLLQAYGPRSISGGFVDRTLQALDPTTDRSDPEPQDLTAAPAWQELFAHHAPKAVSEDFVDRTLAAVLAERRAPAPTPDRGPTPFHWTVSGAALRLVAAIVVAGAIVWFSNDWSERLPGDPPSGPNDQQATNEPSSPVEVRPTSLRLSAQLETRRTDLLQVRDLDPLEILMQRAALAKAGRNEIDGGGRRNR